MLSKCRENFCDIPNFSCVLDSVTNACALILYTGWPKTTASLTRAFTCRCGWLNSGGGRVKIGQRFFDKIKYTNFRPKNTIKQPFCRFFLNLGGGGPPPAHLCSVTHRWRWSSTCTSTIGIGTFSFQSLYIFSWLFRIRLKSGVPRQNLGYLRMPLASGCRGNYPLLTYC